MSAVLIVAVSLAASMGIALLLAAAFFGGRPR